MFDIQSTNRHDIADSQQIQYEEELDEKLDQYVFFESLDEIVEGSVMTEIDSLFHDFQRGVGAMVDFYAVFETISEYNCTLVSEIVGLELTYQLQSGIRSFYKTACEYADDDEEITEQLYTMWEEDLCNSYSYNWVPTDSVLDSLFIYLARQNYVFKVDARYAEDVTSLFDIDNLYDKGIVMYVNDCQNLLFSEWHRKQMNGILNDSLLDGPNEDILNRLSVCENDQTEEKG